MFLLYVPNKFQGTENSNNKNTKIFILDIFSISYYFFRNEDKILRCEFLLCRKYTWNRAAGEKLTISQTSFKGQKIAKKWLKIWDGILLSKILHCTESRPGGGHLMKISGIYHISNTSFQAQETGKNCLKIACFFLTAVWLPHSQLCATHKETASPTQC